MTDLLELDGSRTPTADLRNDIERFELLRMRAQQQMAALASTISQLDQLRKEIKQHLPRSGSSTARRCSSTAKHHSSGMPKPVAPVVGAPSS